MIPFKPHAVSVYPVTDWEVGDLVEGRDLGTPVSVRGMLQPMKADSALRQYGVEMVKPHAFFCEEADASKFDVGYVVKYNDRTFVVRGVMVSDRDMISHCKVALEEVIHALA